MAIFNPQVGNVPNDNMPNFFKFSDSISQPKADESGGIALKTIGNAIEGGVALADTVVKDVIKSEVYNRVDAEREKFTTSLSNAVNYGNAAGPQPGQPDSPVGEYGPNPTPVNIMAGGPQSVPTSITRGLNGIARNEEGLKQDKVTPMKYLENVNTIAKEIRTNHPGYREYIDTEVAKITGGNPANMVMAQYIETINAAMASKNKEQDYWRNKIVESGFPDSDAVLRNYERTGDHNKVMQYLAENNGIRSNLQLRKAAYEDQNNSKEARIKLGVDYANSIVNTAATSAFNNNVKYGNKMSTSEIADKLVAMAETPGAANDEVYQSLSQTYMARHTQAYNTSMRLLTTPQKDEATGKMLPPVSDTIGMPKAKDIVDKTIGALFDKTQEFMADKQFGPAFQVGIASNNMINTATMQVLTNPTVSGSVLTAGVLNKVAPNFAPMLTGSVYAQGLSTALGALTKEQARQAVAQTGGKYTGVDGQIYSFKQSQEELISAEKITGGKTPGQAINNLLEVRKILTDPSSTPEAKNNAIKYFYDPKVNKGSLDNMMDDYYDPAKKGMVRGRSSAFADLTAPEITQSIWDHGGKNAASGAWTKYTTWAKGEFATQLGTGVRDLDSLVKSNSTNFKMSYDGDSKQFLFKDAQGNTPQPSMLTWLYGQKIENLNKGLRSLAEIAKTEGTSTDAYIFRTLKANGFAPDKDVDGIPSQIMQSLIVANGGRVRK